MGRTVGNPPSVPFADLISAELEARGYCHESIAFIWDEYARWTARRPILTERDALAELSFAECADLARRRRNG